MQKHTLTYHEAAIICEMNPAYDSDFSDAALDECRREKRIAGMLTYANASRKQLRSGFIPNPFVGAINIEMLRIARAGEIKTPEEYGVDC